MAHEPSCNSAILSLISSYRAFALLQLGKYPDSKLIWHHELREQLFFGIVDSSHISSIPNAFSSQLDQVQVRKLPCIHSIDEEHAIDNLLGYMHLYSSTVIMHFNEKLGNCTRGGLMCANSIHRIRNHTYTRCTIRTPCLLEEPRGKMTLGQRPRSLRGVTELGDAASLSPSPPSFSCRLFCARDLAWTDCSVCEWLEKVGLLPVEEIACYSTCSTRRPELLRLHMRAG